MNDSSRGQDARILVIEDDETLVRVIVHALSAHGYHVVGAATLADALAHIREHTPSVILVDIDLPDGSGWDAVRAARDVQGSAPNVVVMSALRPNSRLIAELGCFGFLEKPFPIQALLRQVDAALASDVASGGDGFVGTA